MNLNKHQQTNQTGSCTVCPADSIPHKIAVMRCWLPADWETRAAFRANFEHYL